MNHAKTLGLLAVAAAALMAFASTASATLTGPSGTLLNGATIEAEAEGAVSMDGTIQWTCQKSTMKASVTGAGGTSVAVNTLTFTECGKNTVSVLNGGAAGVLSFTSAGTMTSSNAEITVWTHNILGTVHCIYLTSSTDVGTLTEGANATWDVGSVSMPQVGTDFGCSNDATFTGSYKITNPTSLTVD